MDWYYLVFHVAAVPRPTGANGGAKRRAHWARAYGVQGLGSLWQQKQHRKRPQHQCKVCSLRKRKVGERCASRFFCAACSKGQKRVYLCDRVRSNHYPGNRLTCFQIWHSKWNNRAWRPLPLVGRDIQMRGLGKKRRRACTSGGEEDENEQEDDGSVQEEAGEEQDEARVEQEEDIGPCAYWNVVQLGRDLQDIVAGFPNEFKKSYDDAAQTAML
ncbi:hypothetical protein PHMEG_0009209 [Phytophthora megakarya]|uniref:Uncharacterized protein n=1 Tax=Phytophthora megakarya TaxID=4795 RepID=A0A225WJ94_9STRA|nr:hypothetical protein PHMEG_0009209 [Phytophthora megakarya]